VIRIAAAFRETWHLIAGELVPYLLMAAATIALLLLCSCSSWRSMSPAQRAGAVAAGAMDCGPGAVDTALQLNDVIHGGSSDYMGQAFLLLGKLGTVAKCIVDQLDAHQLAHADDGCKTAAAGAASAADCAARSSASAAERLRYSKVRQVAQIAVGAR
jgi:hypothetical protein